MAERLHCKQRTECSNPPAGSSSPRSCTNGHHFDDEANVPHRIDCHHPRRRESGNPGSGRRDRSATETLGAHRIRFSSRGGTGHAYLIEMNPRATQVCHIQLGTDRDLLAPLRAVLSGEAPRQTVPVTERDVNTLFPQEWLSDSTSKVPEYGVPRRPMGRAGSATRVLVRDDRVSRTIPVVGRGPGHDALARSTESVWAGRNARPEKLRVFDGVNA